MKRNDYPALLRLRYDSEHDYWYLWSDFQIGINLAGPDLPKLIRDITPALEKLCELNKITPAQFKEMYSWCMATVGKDARVAE